MSVGTIDVEQQNQKGDKRHKIKGSNIELKVNNSNITDENKYEGSYRRESGQYEGQVSPRTEEEERAHLK